MGSEMCIRDRARIAAKNHTARTIIFCGVHFMAETADILTADGQQVILPDPMAGCSLADMANVFQLRTAWDFLQQQYGDTILPITYVNSTAAIKDFVGRHGGLVVTSGNADRIVAWALARSKHLLFLPDQHLGRNTALKLGVPEEQIAMWQPQERRLDAARPDETRVILWNGFCSVHRQFTVDNVRTIRKNHPDAHVIVHPECCREVVEAADQVGSTAVLIRIVREAPAGSRFAVGTDNNLVGRMMKWFPDKHVMFLNPISCSCILMNRIDQPHLALAMDHLAQHRPNNVIRVAPKTAAGARKALERMFALG